MRIELSIRNSSKDTFVEVVTVTEPDSLDPKELPVEELVGFILVTDDRWIVQETADDPRVSCYDLESALQCLFNRTEALEAFSQEATRSHTQRKSKEKQP